MISLHAGPRPLVMGVVNVTPDSFSDGGEWFEPEAAIAHGRALLAAGADLLDIGGESTRPGADRPSVQEELRRVLPVVRDMLAGGQLRVTDLFDRVPTRAIGPEELADADAELDSLRNLNTPAEYEAALRRLASDP